MSKDSLLSLFPLSLLAIPRSAEVQAIGIWRIVGVLAIKPDVRESDLLQHELELVLVVPRQAPA